MFAVFLALLDPVLADRHPNCDELLVKAFIHTNRVPRSNGSCANVLTMFQVHMHEFAKEGPFKWGTGSGSQQINPKTQLP